MREFNGGLGNSRDCCKIKHRDLYLQLSELFESLITLNTLKIMQYDWSGYINEVMNKYITSHALKIIFQVFFALKLK